MSRAVLERMRARARAVRTRATIRSWNYRQRHLAAGVWFRIRRVLADAREAYVIPGAAAEQLIAEGYKAEPAGALLSPEKTIIVVDSSRLARIDSARRIAVRLDPDFLLAPYVALIPFDPLPEPLPQPVTDRTLPQ